MASNRRLALALLACAAFAAGGAPASAQDEPKPAPPPAPPAAPAEEGKPTSAKEEKVRKYLALTRWKENMTEQFDAAFEPAIRSGDLPKGFSKKFQEVADFAALEEILVSVWSEVFDEATLDAAIEFLATDAGRKYVEAQKKTLRPLLERVQPWAIGTAIKTKIALDEAGGDEAGEDGDEDGGALGNLKKAKLSSNETAAIATLRNLASCQAQMQTSGKIDCDKDDIGEYGTLLEMTGSSGVRTGFQALDRGGPHASGSSDFSKQGPVLQWPILSPALAGVDENGVVVKSGYCFRVFLPDTAEKNAGFVHETGPKDKVGLAGGTGRVCVDLAETTWCAYAWPEKRGDSGNRAFFVSQWGDVFQSANDRTQFSGKGKAPPPLAVFLGAGITSPIAIGTAGSDGEVWKVVN